MCLKSLRVLVHKVDVAKLPQKCTGILVACIAGTVCIKRAPACMCLVLSSKTQLQLRESFPVYVLGITLEMRRVAPRMYNPQPP